MESFLFSCPVPLGLRQGTTVRTKKGGQKREKRRAGLFPCFSFFYPLFISPPLFFVDKHFLVTTWASFFPRSFFSLFFLANLYVPPLKALSDR